MKGGEIMAAYFAIRILDKFKEGSVEAAKAYYRTFLVNTRYSRYRSEVDSILTAENHADLIVSE